jgi:hypothetical protein
MAKLRAVHDPFEFPDFTLQGWLDGKAKRRQLGGDTRVQLRSGLLHVSKKFSGIRKFDLSGSRI